MHFGLKLSLLLTSGILIRIFLFSMCSNDMLEYLSDRIEVLSVFTSFRRISEGKFLVSSGMDPYSSQYFRMNPLVASFLFQVIESKVSTYIFAVVCDVVTAILIARASDAYSLPAAAMFFLNPYTILSELGLSSQSVHVLVMALLIFSVMKEKKVMLTSLWLALLMVLKPLVPIVLVFPIALNLKRPLLQILIASIGFTCLILSLSYFVSGSWSFFWRSIWEPILVSRDLEPNMGMAWCLFSMMFPDSLPLFRLVFQLHLLVFLYPVYIRFLKTSEPSRNQRFLQLTMAAVILFQLYPTGIDYSMFFSVMFACEPRFHDKISLLVTQTVLAGLAFTSVTGPLWIERNTGNGNFLFSLSIVTTFLGTAAVGHSFTLARLDGYTVQEKKNKSE